MSGQIFNTSSGTSPLIGATRPPLPGSVPSPVATPAVTLPVAPPIAPQTSDVFRAVVRGAKVKHEDLDSLLGHEHQASPALLRKGDANGDVSNLQTQLAHTGHAVTVDGKFGPQTEASVKAFQADLGLAVDGLVGPETRGGLAGMDLAAESRAAMAMGKTTQAEEFLHRAEAQLAQLPHGSPKLADEIGQARAQLAQAKVAMAPPAVATPPAPPAVAPLPTPPAASPDGRTITAQSVANTERHNAQIKAEDEQLALIKEMPPEDASKQAQAPGDLKLGPQAAMALATKAQAEVPNHYWSRDKDKASWGVANQVKAAVLQDPTVLTESFVRSMGPMGTRHLMEILDQATINSLAASTRMAALAQLTEPASLEKHLPGKVYHSLMSDPAFSKSHNGDYTGEMLLKSVFPDEATRQKVAKSALAFSE